MTNKFLLLLLFLPLGVHSQTSDERSAIIAVIQKMFDGMRASDSAAVRSVFDPLARLQTTFTDKEGKPQIRSEAVSEFAIAIGMPHEEVYDERIWSYDVRVDDRLASVWTEYTFYLGEKMSHCGVNVFQLFKGENGWKIIQLIDTRRRTNCQTDALADLTAIHQLMDAWHHAAAVADEDVFFGSMTADAIYLGTDASERWLRDELKEWSKQFFDKESAWAFTAKNRQVYFAQSADLAWFEESLETWMGPCRGSGVLQKLPGGWKIKHYNLAIAVPNNVVDGLIELMKKK